MIRNIKGDISIIVDSFKALIIFTTDLCCRCFNVSALFSHITVIYLYIVRALVPLDEAPITVLHDYHLIIDSFGFNGDGHDIRKIPASY